MGVVDVYRGDNGALVVNASDISLGPVADAISDAQPSEEQRQIMSAMASWVGNSGGSSRRKLQGIFDRDTYVSPNSVFDKIRVARTAVRRDDIVGRAARLTEALALNATTIRCTAGPTARRKDNDVLDQQDVWNQIAGDLDLDSRLREMWRVLFHDSQMVCAVWWHEKAYRSRRPTKEGQAPRKEYRITVPAAISMIDTTRVTPIGALMFNQERLAFIASPLEADYLDRMLAQRDGVPLPPPRFDAGRGRQSTTIYNDAGQRLLAPTVPETGIAMVDPIVARLITGRYVPDALEAEQLRCDGVDPTHLFAFDPRYVFRHTKTRPQFERFANVDLEMVFELLDAKHQLRQLDRAHLLGGANYIVLVTKGSEKQPATQPEIDNLRSHVRTLGQIPVLVGDNRLKVEIVTPKLDVVLDRKKHDTIDVRISAAVYGMFTPAGEGNDDPLKAGRVIARGLESERRMLRRRLEAEIFQMIRDANPGVMTARAKLVFLPGTISLSFDSSWATFLMDLRESGELSRESMLSQMDFDQADEAALLELEAEEYDQIFKTIVPHGTNPQRGDQQQLPANTDPTQKRALQRRAGRRQGGNNNGGGRAPGTRQGQESIDPRRSMTGPTRKPRADVVEALATVAVLADEPSIDEVDFTIRGLARDDLIAVASAIEDPVKGRHRMRSMDLIDELTTRAADTDEEDA